MDRIKEFLRAKGLYIAIATGVLAFACLLVIYNYNTYKSEFGIDGQAVDLNTPEVTETNSDDAVAGDTDAPPADVQMSDADAQSENDDSAGTVDAAGAQSGSDSGADMADAQSESDNSVDTVDAAGAQSGSDSGADMADAQSESDDSAGTVDAAGAQSGSDNSTDAQTDTAQTGSDGVIVDEEGVVVANAYNEGSTLVWPVEGSVILPFSMDTTVYFKTLGSYRCNPGVLIAAEEGENVLAAYEGVVTSVTDDKEYGTTVTVEMGNGYEATYGQLMNVTVAEGDAIATAQNIGEAAAPTSYYTEEGTHVFFKLTKNDVPINPMILMAD